MPVIELATPKIRKLVRNSKGQILVEYLLLMVIAIGCGTLLTKGLVGRSGEGGTIIKQWDRIIKIIGHDVPDCANQTNFDTPNCKP